MLTGRNSGYRYFQMECSGDDRFQQDVQNTTQETPSTPAQSSTTTNDMKTTQITESQVTTKKPIISPSTIAQSKIVTFATLTTQMMNDSRGQNGLITLPKVLFTVLIITILFLILAIFLLTCYIIKRRSSEQNDRNQAINPNACYETTSGVPTTTTPVYVNVPNQTQAPVADYESVNMRLLSQSNPEGSLYTSLASNENRNTYLEPVNTHRNSIESELNEPYEIIE